MAVELASQPAQPLSTYRHNRYYINGPGASAIVYDMDHAAAVIEALCSVTKDDPSEYTTTDMGDPDDEMAS